MNTCRGFRELPQIRFRLLFIPITDHRLPTTDLRPPITDYLSPITDHRFPTTDHRLPTTDYRPPITVHRSLFTVHCSPFTVHGSPFHTLQTLSLFHHASPLPQILIKPRGCPFSYVLNELGLLETVRLAGVHHHFGGNATTL